MNCSTTYQQNGVAVCSGATPSTSWGAEYKSGDSACAAAGYSSCTTAYNSSGGVMNCSSAYQQNGVAVCSGATPSVIWANYTDGDASCANAGYSSCITAYDKYGNSRACYSNQSGGVAICSA